MALSGTITGSTNNAQIAARIEWSATQNVANNTSTITAILKYKRNNTGYITEGGFNGSITINGVKKSLSVSHISITESGWTEAGRHSVVVAHNNDGSKTTTLAATGEVYGTTLDSTYINGSITLDTIYKKASITAAPNFSDEQNPTITYANPAGTAATDLAACISFTGANPDIAYRSISKTGTSYTFNLTEAERNVLRNGTATANSRTVYFYIRSTVNGETFYSKVAKTLTIVNANPTLNPTAVDNGTYSKVLTGAPSTTIIKGYNSMAVNTGAAARKGATLKSFRISCGGKSITTASGTLSNVSSGTFTFVATDSRGNSTTQTLTKTMVNYVELSCNLVVANPTAAGTMDLTVSGNYFNGSFGAVANALTVQYRIKENDGSFSAWKTISPTLNGNKYTATLSLTGLNYQSTYSIQARAADKVYTGTGEAQKATPIKIVKTTPVFDWGANDFKFNVPVEFKAGAINHNVLLWQGGYYMTAGQTATLASPISSQTSGIVLVFSNYDTANSKANDYDWHCYFVPKYLVDIKGGTGHCFNMMSQSFGDVASKYIYINDTSLTGHDNNTKSATNNGITYNNAKYVLRYVFGV